jgi:hypothetical protein
MRKLMISVTAAILSLVLALPAFGTKPADPGCFGTDRAENNTTWIMDEPDPGASWWGHEAASRANTNGERNRSYIHRCGGFPQELD